MRMFFRPPILLFILILPSLGWYCLPVAIKTALALDIDEDRVLWNRLSYRAKSLFGKVTTDVLLMAVPVEEVADLLITDPAGEGLQPSGATVISITVDSNINPIFGSNEILKTQSWSNPNDAAALQHVRLRQGGRIWQKSYRFQPDGVYHQRKQPADKKQLELPPEQWTTFEKRFYQYNGKDHKCPAVLEPSGLLYFVSGIDLRSQKSPLSLCVFDKQQLHLVKITARGTRQLKVNYLERSQDKQIRRERIIDVLKISFQPRSLASPNIAPKAFSFLGLKGDFDIFIDQASCIPVQVSGKISTIGKVDIRLQEVNLTPGNS